ncbi:MAG: zinc ABC transporter substrate-binding protein, partial [Actinobacteria bacterium]|nr:zinc ABC transporter substrate-binding protein [Actinomycetota bacterium]
MRIIPRVLFGICPVLLAVSACSSSSALPDVKSELPTVVVTYSVLGNIVEQLVGDAATVTTLIPDGQDPHEFEPSAKDIESLNNANIVVSNGLDFEEGLEETLNNVKTAGVNVFMAGDYITVRELSDEDHDHGAFDP